MSASPAPSAPSAAAATPGAPPPPPLPAACGTTTVLPKTEPTSPPIKMEVTDDVDVPAAIALSASRLGAGHAATNGVFLQGMPALPPYGRGRRGRGAPTFAANGSGSRVLQAAHLAGHEAATSKKRIIRF